MKIFLVDLTHDGLILSSKVFPLSIGLIAAYLSTKRTDVEVELFKYPDDFSLALKKTSPDVIGFANYSWNFELSRGYAKAIKKIWPNTVIVFGGPNYGTSEAEVESFWEKNPNVDFYIVHEGEEAFLQLVNYLDKYDFDINMIKRNGIKIGNVHYSYDGKIIKGDVLPRLRLEDLPSPYLMGLMDSFFDKNLAPLIHTTRGCPFSCAFCTEGKGYYNKVKHRLNDLDEELHYISKRVIGPKDLYISDANFGMYSQDIEKSEVLANCQKAYDYPQHIYVSTGKNKKERIIDIVKKLNGAINMAASLQSTNNEVLENVNRSNISLDKLSSSAKAANSNEMGTYSELILGLPGDTVAAHKKSLRDTVDMGFDNIRMYQLIMLPQTLINTDEYRSRYNMKTMHRIMPRSFGKYKVKNEEFSACESEEILVSNNTLKFEDYVTCREMDLTIEILHNGRIFEELQGLCSALDLSWFDFINYFFDNRMIQTQHISKMYSDFKIGTSAMLWDNADELFNYTNKNMDDMLKNEKGTNEMSAGKATAFFTLFEEMNRVLFNLMTKWLGSLNKCDDTMKMYLNELEKFSLMRKQSLFINNDEKHIECFCFDFIIAGKQSYKVLPDDIRLTTIKKIIFFHDKKQSDIIINRLSEFDKSMDGIGKMLMAYPHIYKLFRKAGYL